MSLEMEIDKGRKYNYDVLYYAVKHSLIQKKMNDIDLFVQIFSNSIDQEVEDCIRELVRTGKVDSMFMPVTDEV